MAAKKQAVKKQRGRSDIPYALRMQQKREAEIDLNVDYAIRTQMKIAMVALNDISEFGMRRLKRFADRMREINNEWLRDPELTSARIDRRLGVIGFDVQGVNVMTYLDENENPIKGVKTGDNPTRPQLMMLQNRAERMLTLLKLIRDDETAFSKKFNDEIDADTIRILNQRLTAMDYALGYLNEFIDSLQEAVEE